MTVDFGDYFWGDKNNGFDVLYHNMKYGLVASKELTEFLRERSNIEENNSKLLGKLAKQAGGGCMQGTFAPLWQVLRSTAEKLACIHLQMVQKVADLVKDVSKYADELQKKHKSVKEDECGTLEVVQAIQSTSATLQKAKDTCNQKRIEYEKLKRDNASPRDLEKAEVKLRKAQEDYKALVEKYSVVKEEFEKKMSLACKHFQEVEEDHLRHMKEFLNTYADLVEANHDLIGQVHIDFKRQCLEMTVENLLEQFVRNKYTGVDKPGAKELEEMNLGGGGDGHHGGGGGLISSMTTAVPAVSSSSSSLGTNGDTIINKMKREGNGSVWTTATTKQSRRTTSLLNLFISNSQVAVAGSGGSCKEEVQVVAASPLPPTSSAPTSPTATGTTTTTSLARNPLRGSKWFLKSRRKRKEKSAKKKKDGASHADNASNKDDKSDNEEKEDIGNKSKTPTPDVDEEGYCIRPKIENWENDKLSFYSSSDTDSDDERERKIHVEIKPLSNGAGPMSASVDELRATVENLSLSPIAILPGHRSSAPDVEHHMKRSQSVSQQIGGKVNSDLVDLNLFQSATGSSASTPTSSHPYAPLQSPTLNNPAPPPPASAPPTSYADLGDIFSEVGEIEALPTKHGPAMSRQTPTPTSSIAIPRPPSRRGEGRGRISPSSSQGGGAGPAGTGGSIIARADSIGSLGSLEFRTAGVSIGSSRGPSPLTIGMSDTIPLAVAFHEIIHSYFRGTDETKCQVKLSGDMMVSFPAGIVAVLANNPNPAQLTFRVRNSGKLENVLPNTQLVSLDSSQTTNESSLYEFNMCALTSLLRRQSEQNPSASYFNVDILKYQIKAKCGAGSCPFQLVAYWKCETNQTDLKIDYKYNSHAMASPSPLLNLTITVPVNGSVKSVQSKPTAHWINDSQRAVWKLTELSQHSENHGVGSLRARCEVSDGPSSQSTIAAQFNCEGTTLSGAEFELIGSGYRLSLVKRRFVSGKYICDGDLLRYTPKRTSSPPS